MAKAKHDSTTKAYAVQLQRQQRDASEVQTELLCACIAASVAHAVHIRQEREREKRTNIMDDCFQNWFLALEKKKASAASCIQLYV
eukprot:SAG31_NODE_1042_length_10187_cov_54.452121_12_plen_86_part_00